MTTEALQRNDARRLPIGQPTSAPSSWLESLEQRTPPHFNQLVVWSLLGTAFVLALSPFQLHHGPRAGVATLLWWLPDVAVYRPWTWYTFRVALLAGCSLWLLQRLLPWSCWLVVLAFTGLWSLHVETTHNTAHIFHMANLLLVIQAIWITADAPLIRARLRERTYYQLPLVPRWVSLASIAYIGIFHTAAGISKLAFSGPEWASGVSLQLWTYLWGRPWSPTTKLMLGSRGITQFLQILTLVFETAGVLAVVPRLRSLIGWGLLAFYAGVLATFDYGFQFNALFTALYFLPFEGWITNSVTTKMKNPPR